MGHHHRSTTLVCGLAKLCRWTPLHTTLHGTLLPGRCRLGRKSCWRMQQHQLFGCGFFDDSGDIPGMPVLFYTLQHEAEGGDGGGAGGAGDDGAGGASGGVGAGDGDAAGGSAGGDAGALADAATAAATSEGPSFVKLYEEPIPHRVQYAEIKQGVDGTGQATLAGSWSNVLEATMGVFAARLEPPSEGFQVAPPADAAAAAAAAAAAPLAAIGE